MPPAALPATQQADTTADCLASRPDYVGLHALPLGCAPVGLNLQAGIKRGKSIDVNKSVLAREWAYPSRRNTCVTLDLLTPR